jgi:nitroreductase
MSKPVSISAEDGPQLSSTMPSKPVPTEQLLGQLHWRYATKQFDSNRKIDARTWAALEEALTLSASSGGLQPWFFIVITDPNIRRKLAQRASQAFLFARLAIGPPAIRSRRYQR